MTITEAIQMQDCAFNDGVETAARFVETNKALWYVHTTDPLRVPAPDHIANELRALKRGAIPDVDYVADENYDGRGTA